MDLVGSIEPPQGVAVRKPLRKGRRAQHVPSQEDRLNVLAWVAGGITQSAMASLLEIDERTLRNHYRTELNSGVMMANGKIVGSLFGKALAGDTTSMIWWTKTRMGWHEKAAYGPDNPLVVQSESAMDPVQLARALRDALLEMRAQPRLTSD